MNLFPQWKKDGYQNFQMSRKTLHEKFQTNDVPFRFGRIPCRYLYGVVLPKYSGQFDFGTGNRYLW
jgi:hypothetical protein